MRVEELSTYGADQLNVSRRRTQDAEIERDLAAVSQMETAVQLDTARRSKSLLRRVFRRSTEDEQAAQADHEVASRRADRAGAAQEAASVRVRQRETGERGEERLSHAMTQRLSDEWIMFRGYMSKRGEADAVLVGPRGVWVVEVKTRRVRLFIDGEDWQYQKLSRAGRAYERGPAVDGGKRVWGRQASDAAASLGWWLDHNDRSAPTRTAVVLMATGAEVAECRTPGVDLVTVGPAELEKVMRQAPLSIDLLHQRDIEDLIRRDHAHSIAQRAKRRRSSDRRG